MKKTLLIPFVSLAFVAIGGVLADSGGARAEQYIDTSGDSTTAGTNWLVNSDQSIFAAWARKCVNPVSNGSCTLTVQPSGAYSYQTSCNTGYDLTAGAGTYNPTCTPHVYTIELKDYTGTTTVNTVYEKYATGWYSDANATAGNELTTAPTPTRAGYAFRGYYTSTQADLTASGGTGTLDINKNGTWPVTDPVHTKYTANTPLYAAWAQNPTTAIPTGDGANHLATSTLTVNNDGTVTYAATCIDGYQISGNGTATPTCSAITYTVTLSAPDANINADAYTKSVQATFDAAMPAIAVLPQRTGYTFTGYFDQTDPNDPIQYYEGAENNGAGIGTWDQPNNATLLAQWSANQYAFTYDCGDGEEPPVDLGAILGIRNPGQHHDATLPEATYDQNFTPASVDGKCVKTGYHFTGWQVESDNSIKQPGTAFLWQYTEDQTVVAQWEPDTYVITLNDNATTVTGLTTPGMGTIKEVYDTKWTNSSNVDITSVTTPVRTGYTFRGYYSDATLADVESSNNGAGNTGTQVITADGTPLPENTDYLEDTTLIAGWARNCIVPSNGTCTMDVTDAGVVTYTTSCNAGYTISGAGTYNPTCTANTYTVVFNKTTADGTETMANQTFTYDVAQNLTANAFTKTGYTFTGWSRTEGGIKAFDNQESVSNLTTEAGGTVTLYAVWTANTFTVNYDFNQPTADGTLTITNNTMASSQHTYDDASTLTANTFAITGWSFTGWNTSANGNGTPLADGAPAGTLVTTPGGSITLYAQWSPNCLVITLNKGDEADASQDGKVTTLYRRANMYGWYSDATCQTTWTGSANVIPSSTNYEFRGFFKPQQTKVEGGTSADYVAPAQP